MKINIDPKPLGAFIEYTLKPIIEDARDLLEMCEGKLDINVLIHHAYRIFILQHVSYMVTSILVTGMICLTAYAILSSSLNTLR